jgi:hypothetical protein
MRFFKSVSLDGKGGDIFPDRPRSMFASEEQEVSSWAWKGEDRLGKPETGFKSGPDDFTWKWNERLEKPGSEFDHKASDFSWKFDERLEKPGSEFEHKASDFTWKVDDRLSKPEESRVKPVPAIFAQNADPRLSKPGSEYEHKASEFTWKIDDRLKKPDTSYSKTYKFNQLQGQQQENRQFTSMSNIMKTKHDTAKSAINNVR